MVAVEMRVTSGGYVPLAARHPAFSTVHVPLHEGIDMVDHGVGEITPLVSVSRRGGDYLLVFPSGFDQLSQFRPQPVGHSRNLSSPSARKPNARAVTRKPDWCRGKTGVEHLPSVSLPSPGSVRCHSHKWWDLDEPVWSCWHVSRCERCGKHLDKNIRGPDLPDGVKQLGIAWPMTPQSRYEGPDV
jgi:hypothetical protein